MLNQAKANIKTQKVSIKDSKQQIKKIQLLENLSFMSSQHLSPNVNKLEQMEKNKQEKKFRQKMLQKRQMESEKHKESDMSSPARMISPLKKYLDRKITTMTFDRHNF